MAPVSLEEAVDLAVLTEQEIVAALYPDSYLDHLDYLQDLAISGGVMDESERAVFDTRESIQKIHLRFIDYVASQNIITQTEKSNFIDGINNVLPELQIMEIEAIEQNNQSALPASYLVACTLKSEPSVVSEIVDFFAPVFKKIGIRPAYAQDCFKSGVGGPVGANLWAPCCSCCIFIGKACVPVGCLNAVCRFGAAIWDPATGICGCG